MLQDVRKADVKDDKNDEFDDDGDNNIISRCQSPAPVNQCSLCVVFGDPHVFTFNRQFQTCRVVGTWPLVDNEYLTVQITNSHMGWGNGTAVSKVAHNGPL